MNITAKIMISGLLSATCLTAALLADAGPYEDGIAADSARNHAVSFPAFKKAAAKDDLVQLSVK